MIFGDDITRAAETLLSLCRRQGFRVVTVESCTGGLVAGAITEIPGSSDIFDRGFVTYSNAAKTDLVGVPADLIERVGAVSPEVAIAMAKGALTRSDADLAVGVTGLAGPGGGTLEKPVGLVHFAVARRGRSMLDERRVFPDGDRSAIRLAAVQVALELLIRQAGP